MNKFVGAMGETRRGVNSSSNLLPCEVICSEILPWLPVRSLVRFRCVSKSWRACIDNPSFARLHLTHGGAAEPQQLLVILESSNKGRSECLVCCTKTWSYNTASLGLIGNEIGEWDVASSLIYGLIMLVSRDFRRRELMLWNPSIRKSRRIPYPPEISVEMRAVDLGLGFDPFLNDYKYVMFVHSAKFVLQFFAVYTLGTNSWKTIEFRHDVDQYAHDDYDCIPEPGAVCVRGVMYALTDDLLLVSFDLSNETFDYSVSYPRDFNSQGHNSWLTTADGGRWLAMVTITDFNGYICVLQGTTWIRRYKFALAFPQYDTQDCHTPDFLYLRNNGELLLDWLTVVTSSNLETQEEKIVLKKRLEWADHTFAFTESLLLLSSTN